MDKENVISLIKCKEHELYEDCMKTMRKQLNVHFNFKKDDLDEFITAWFMNFTSGIGKDTKQTFNETLFPNRPLKSNSYTKFDKDQLSSVYLLSDERIDLLIGKGAVLIGSPGSEISMFNNLFLNQDEYKFEKKIKIKSPEFSSWRYLESLSKPVSDIILIDPYILDDPSAIPSNILEYLKVMVNQSKCCVNIIIYTNNKNVRVSYSEISTAVRTAVRSVTGVSPSFTLVKVNDQSGVDSFAEHDRTIFTNYYRVYSGDTFNYFRSNGSKVTKGREIQYSSLADRENHKLAKTLIDDIQNNLDSLPPTATEGDKKSNFLTFK